MTDREITINDRTGVREVSVDLQQDGLLWLINRVVFHPRGFALALNPKTGEFTLWGNGDEPWLYDEELDEDDRFKAVERLFSYVRETQRS